MNWSGVSVAKSLVMFSQRLVSFPPSPCTAFCTRILLMRQRLPVILTQDPIAPPASVCQANADLLSTKMFLLNVLGWPWLIKWHGFQGFTSIMRHLCIVRCSPPQASVLPSPFVPLALLPAPSPPQSPGWSPAGGGITDGNGGFSVAAGALRW